MLPPKMWQRHHLLFLPSPQANGEQDTQGEASGTSFLAGGGAFSAAHKPGQSSRQKLHHLTASKPSKGPTCVSAPSSLGVAARSVTAATLQGSGRTEQSLCMCLCPRVGTILTLQVSFQKSLPALPAGNPSSPPLFPNPRPEATDKREPSVKSRVLPSYPPPTPEQEGFLGTQSKSNGGGGVIIGSVDNWKPQIQGPTCSSKIQH